MTIDHLSNLYHAVTKMYVSDDNIIIGVRHNDSLDNEESWKSEASCIFLAYCNKWLSFYGSGANYDFNFARRSRA